VAAAQIVNALQSIVARNVAPLETAVVSVTAIHGGEAFNVIPQEVELRGTIRTFDVGVRGRVINRFHEIVQGVAQSLGCAAQIEVKRVTPATVNDAAIAAKVQETARRVLPESQLNTLPFVTMGSEDMGFMLEQIPGCYFLVGSANHARGLDYGHHHPKFDFDEEALAQGAALMASAAADMLK
jgi:amidohydrolase